MNQMEMWTDVQAENKEINFKDVDALCEKIVAQREICDKIYAEKKEADKTLEELEYKMLETLGAMGKDAYLSNHGRFGVSYRTSIRLPVGDEKIRFLDYLKERGIHDQMVSVNSNTLNGWYKKEFELAKEEGRVDSFSIPGLGEPTITPILSLRKN